MTVVFFFFFQLSVALSIDGNLWFKSWCHYLMLLLICVNDYWTSWWFLYIQNLLFTFIGAVLCIFKLNAIIPLFFFLLAKLKNVSFFCNIMEIYFWNFLVLVLFSWFELTTIILFAVNQQEVDYVLLTNRIREFYKLHKHLIFWLNQK